MNVFDVWDLSRHEQRRNADDDSIKTEQTSVGVNYLQVC
jgi:hypothetical protein